MIVRQCAMTFQTLDSWEPQLAIRLQADAKHGLSLESKFFFWREREVYDFMICFLHDVKKHYCFFVLETYGNTSYTYYTIETNMFAPAKLMVWLSGWCFFSLGRLRYGVGPATWPWMFDRNGTEMKTYIYVYIDIGS